jgi:hypothetical protein
MRALNIPTSEPVGGTLLVDLKALGYDIIRIDCQDTDLHTTRALAQEVLDAGLQPWAIIHTPEQMAVLPDGSLMELGNEPDLDIPTPHGTRYHWTKSSYLQQARCCIEAAGETKKLYVYGVSNLNRRGFDFMPPRPIWNEWGQTIGAAPHRYPEGGGDWHTPHAGFRSRQAEIDRLHEIIGPRPKAIGEFGWNHSTEGWSLPQCADYIAHDYDFYLANGFEVACLYEINDGPNRNEVEQNYGIRDFQGGEWNVTATAMMDG